MEATKTKKLTADELEALKAQMRKLKREASETAMELHDLTEELPGAYMRIMDVAHTAFLKHSEYFKVADEVKRYEGEK